MSDPVTLPPALDPGIPPDVLACYAIAPMLEAQMDYLELSGDRGPLRLAFRKHVAAAISDALREAVHQTKRQSIFAAIKMVELRQEIHAQHMELGNTHDAIFCDLEQLICDLHHLAPSNPPAETARRSPTSDATNGR